MDLVIERDYGAVLFNLIEITALWLLFWFINYNNSPYDLHYIDSILDYHEQYSFYHLRVSFSIYELSHSVYYISLVLFSLH